MKKTIQEKLEDINRIQNPPTCINTGCDKKCAVAKKSFRGVIRHRLVCGACHRASYGKQKYKKGVTPWKKNYCENKDGRLGFKCKAVIKDSCQLQMDHINGDRHNNEQDNVQTLCANCHSWKTKFHKDTNGNKYLKKNNENKA